MRSAFHHLLLANLEMTKAHANRWGAQNARRGDVAREA